MANLTAPHGPLAFFLDLEPPSSDFLSDALEGLSAPQKHISPMYFYDAYGSSLFEAITKLDAYYPTRTERAIMIEHGAAISEAIGRNALVVEYGAGAPTKIKRLLSLLQDPTGYVAIDISGEHLVEGMSSLANETPGTPIAAICADFNQEIRLPSDHLPASDSRLGYFPGSTLGNLTPSGAQDFLNNASNTLGPNAHMLIGIDLYKDHGILQRAYDDEEGVTAAFNLNLLHRLRSELEADLSLEDFEHEARICTDPTRVEMHLRAKRATRIVLSGQEFTFAAGETLHTENSHKYTLENIDALLEPTVWRREAVWSDPQDWFAVCLLSNN